MITERVEDGDGSVGRVFRILDDILVLLLDPVFEDMFGDGSSSDGSGSGGRGGSTSPSSSRSRGRERRNVNGEGFGGALAGYASEAA